MLLFWQLLEVALNYLGAQRPFIEGDHYLSVAVDGAFKGIRLEPPFLAKEGLNVKVKLLHFHCSFSSLA